MQNNGSVDMTQGPILKKLLKLAIPIMGTQVIQMLYNLTDMFYVGRLGSYELAATGAAGLYMWLSMALMLLGSAGAGIGVSQALGAKDEPRAKSFVQNALFLSVVLGTLFAVVLFVFRREMVNLFSFQEEQVAAYTQQYLAIVSIPIPFTYISATLSATFNASGHPRTPMIANLIGAAINVILDPLLMFNLGLGVEGAAIATAIGQTVVCVLLVTAMKASKHRPFENFAFVRPPDRALIAQITKWTIPMSIESGMFTFMVMLTSRREAFFGADALAISRVGSQIESLTWLVGGAFGSALTAFVGQNFGAKQWQRIRQTFSISTRIMAVYGFGVSLILAFAGRYIFSLFLPDPALAERSIAYLRIIAICQIPSCLENVAACTFRGRGRTLPPSIVNVTGNVLRVPLAYVLSMTSLGLIGVWVGITISSCIKGIWSYTWYRFEDRRELAAGR